MGRHKIPAEEQAVLEAAVVWFCRKKPLSFSFDDHLANPEINTPDPGDKILARAVAAMLHRG